MKFQLFMIACITCLSGNVQAVTTQSQASIQSAAEDFMMKNVRQDYGKEARVKAGHLDSRLRLAKCTIPLETFQPNGSHTLGNTTVGVRCSGGKPWTLYVPVKVSIYENVVVSSRQLQKGKQITRHDLKLVERNIAELRSGYYSSLQAVVGKQLSRSISIGAAITSLIVKNPLQIKRGQHINLVAISGGLRVQMKGKALVDGSNGEYIEVKNLSTKQVIEGMVISATTVQVDL